MKISLVITTYNRFDMTWHLLDSLWRTARRGDLELILVDNGSSDETPTLAQFADDFLVNTEQGNLARSLNLGVRRARGDWVGLFNNDLVFLTRGWDEALRCRLTETSADIVTPLQIEGSGFSEDLGALSAAVDDANLAACTVIESLTSHLEMSCSFFRASALDSLGEFDESLPTWYHHQDYYVRICEANSPMERLYNVLVRHFGNRTIGYNQTPEVDARLRAEYAHFAQRYPASVLDPLGLTMPPFGPFDLSPVHGPTVLGVEHINRALHYLARRRSG